MRIEPFQPSHLGRLEIQMEQQVFKQYFGDPSYLKLLANGKSFSGVDGDRIMCCAGVVPLWDGRAEAWALMGHELNRDFVRIHRATMRYMEIAGIRRIEANVDTGFENAKRWMDLLGFKEEGVMRAFTPDGRDCIRYARVRD